MKKKLIIIGLMAMLLPLNAKALTGNVSMSCNSTTLNPGGTTDCTIIGNITEEVSAVSMDLKLGSNLTLEKITPSSAWQGDGEGGDIDLYTDTNKKGKFEIATFTIKAASIKEGATTNLSLSNVTLSDKNFEETTFKVSDLSIKIPSTINTLSSLKVDDKVVDGFSADKTTYTMTVDVSKTKINIAATATASSSKITGDIGEKTLKSGSNKFNISVKSESGLEKKYVLEVIKPEIKKLKTLSINNDTIKLEEGKYEYSHTIKNDVTSIDIKAELNDTKLTAFVDGYGARKVENLKVGANEILIKIKDNLNEEKTYKIIVNRLNEDGKTESTDDKESTGATDDKENTESTDDKENTESTVKNPNTGIKISYILFIVTSIVGVVIYFVIRNKSKFPKKI